MVNAVARKPLNFRVRVLCLLATIWAPCLALRLLSLFTDVRLCEVVLFSSPHTEEHREDTVHIFARRLDRKEGLTLADSTPHYTQISASSVPLLGSFSFSLVAQTTFILISLLSFLLCYPSTISSLLLSYHFLGKRCLSPPHKLPPLPSISLNALHQPTTHLLDLPRMALSETVQLSYLHKVILVLNASNALL